MKEFTKKIDLEKFALQKYREHIKDNNYVFPDHLLVPEYNGLSEYTWMNIKDLSIYEEAQRGRAEGYKNKNVKNICNPETFDWLNFHPIIVAVIDNKNIVVDGFGRLLGCLPLGMKKIPAHIFKYEDGDYESVYKHYMSLHDEHIRTKIKKIDDHFTGLANGFPDNVELNNEICKNFIFDKELCLTPKKKARNIFTQGDFDGIMFQIHDECSKNKEKIFAILNFYKKARTFINEGCPIAGYNTLLNNIYVNIHYLIKNEILDKQCNLISLIDDDKLNKFDINKFTSKYEDEIKKVNKKSENEKKATANRSIQFLELINKAKICNNAWLVKSESNKDNNMIQILINEIKKD